jgi:heterodisulfide reductase subunit B
MTHSFLPPLAGRNLAIAARQGCEAVMTPCPGCLKSLKGAQEIYEHPKQREVFRELVGMEIDGCLKAVSLLQLLYEEVGVEVLQKAIRRPLTGHVIVPCYGCLLTRPAQIALFDDPENPISMDRLIQTTGPQFRTFLTKQSAVGPHTGLPATISSAS